MAISARSARNYRITAGHGRGTLLRYGLGRGGGDISAPRAPMSSAAVSAGSSFADYSLYTSSDAIPPTDAAWTAFDKPDPAACR